MSDFVDLVEIEGDGLYQAPAFSGLKKGDTVILDETSNTYKVAAVLTVNKDSEVYNFVIGLFGEDEPNKVKQKVEYRNLWG